MSEQVGSIHFKADTTDLERAAKALDKLAQAGPRVSNSLASAEQSVAKTGKSLATIGNSSRGLDTVDQAAKTAASGLNQAANAAEGVRTAVGRAGQSATGLDSIASGSAQATRGLNDAAASMLNLRGAIASAGIAVAAKQFIDVADSVTVLNNQLKLATGSTQAAASAYSSLFEIAQRSRVSFTALGDTFASIARAAQPLGVSQERLLKVTESIGNAMTISGGSAQSLQAALVQLGQGLSAGTLRGEELNSVMEQAPRLAKALADGLGVTTGQLRALGQEGEITAEKVIKALESQSSVLKGEVAGATLTVGQAFTQLSNSSTKAVGDFDLASGASSALAQAISSIASTMDGLGDAFARNEPIIKSTMGALAGGAALATLTAMPRAIGAVGGAITALGAVLAANPVVLGLLGVGVVVGGGIGAINAYKKTADGIRSTIDALEKENARAQKALDWSAGMGGAYQKADDRTRQLIAERTAQVEKLRDELRKLEAGEVTGAGGGRGSVNPPTIAESSAKQAQQEEALTEARRKLHGISKDYLSELKKLNELYTSGAMPLDEYQQHVAKLATDTYNASTAGKAQAEAMRISAQATKASASAYESLSKSVAEKIAAQRQELIYGTRLTDIDKLRIRVEQEMTGARKAGLLAMLEVAKANERELEARAAFLDLAEAEKKARMELAASAEKEAEGFAEASQRLREEIELIGLSEEAQHAINQARLQAQITIKEQHLAELQRANDVFGFMSREQIALEEQIRLLKERLGLMDDKRVRDANAKAQDRLEKEWDRTAQTIGDTLADYIMSGGKDAATYLKRLFSTLVLQPVVQAGVGSLLGGAGGSASGQSGGYGSILSTVSNLKSAYSLVTGGLVSSIANGVGAIGTAIGSSAATSFAAGMKGASLASGLAGPTTAGATGAMGWGASAASAIPVIGWIAAGMGASASAYSQGYTEKDLNWANPIGLVEKSATRILTAVGVSDKLAHILTGASLTAKIFDKLGLGGETPHRGAAAEYLSGEIISSGKEFTKRAANNAKFSSDVQGSINALSGMVGGALDAVAQMFGKTSGYRVAAGFTSDGKDKSHGLFRVTDTSGDQLVQWLAKRSGEFGSRATGYAYNKDAAKGYDEYLKSVTAATIPLLKDIAPDWADALLTGAVSQLGYSGDAKDWKSIQTTGAESLDILQGVVQQIALTKAAFQELGETMEMFSGVSVEVESALLNAFGGIEGVAQVAGQFYQGYYSEQERMLNARRQQMEALASMGLYIDPAEGEKAKALFKQTVEEAMRSGQGELAVKLMAMSASFAQVADYATKLFDDVETAARDAAEAAQELALANAENVVDGAWRNFESAVNREKDYWQEIASASQEAISMISGSVSLLQSNARDLYGTVDSTQQMLAAQGMVYIENALSSVRGGSSITGFDGLQDAISAARGGISGGVYASEFERQRDTLVLAGQLSELGELSDAQLSVEEKALKAAQEQIEQLDATLEYWQQQLDGTAQLIDTGLSIESAISALSAAIAARDAVQKAASGGGGGSSGGGASSGGVLQKIGDAWASGDWITAQNYIRGQGISNQQLQDAFGLSHADLSYLYNNGITTQNPGQYSFKADTAEGVYAEAKAQGLSLSDVDRILGAGAGEAEEWAKKMGLPIFHQGTPYVQRTGFAVLKQGEAVVPEAFNPWANGASAIGGGNAEVVAELRALREQNARLEERLAAIEGSNDKIAQVLVDVTDDGNAMVTQDLETL